MSCAVGNFCRLAYNKPPDGNLLSIHEQIDLRNVMKNIPVNTPSMFSPNGKLYLEYTFDELIGLSDSDMEQTSD